jgi:hypothetical protein
MAMTKNADHDYGYRALAARIILDAYDDIDRKTDYKSQYATMVAQDAKDSSVRFFKSPWFLEIAEGLKLSGPKIKTAALK